MNRGALNDVLQGGYIRSYQFSMEQNLCVLDVDVLENGVLSTHEIRFEKISRFVFETESGFEGDRLELTEIWIDSAPEGSSTEEWIVVISIFDMTHLRIQCSIVEIDGRKLT